MVMMALPHHRHHHQQQQQQQQQQRLPTCACMLLWLAVAAVVLLAAAQMLLHGRFSDDGHTVQLRQAPVTTTLAAAAAAAERLGGREPAPPSLLSPLSDGLAVEKAKVGQGGEENEQTRGDQAGDADDYDDREEDLLAHTLASGAQVVFAKSSRRCHPESVETGTSGVAHDANAAHAAAAAAPAASADSGGVESRVHMIGTMSLAHGMSSERQRELVRSLMDNVRLHNELACIHLFIEEDSFLPTVLSIAVDNLGISNAEGLLRERVQVVRVRAQPTYGTLIAYANEILPHKSIALVSNADIVFDESLGQAGKALEVSAHYLGAPSSAMALSRRPHPECPHESGGNGINTFDDLCAKKFWGGSPSADAFVFQTPLVGQNELYSELNFVQNRWGAENLVIYYLKRYGMAVINPCFLIHAFHRHCVQERTHVSNPDKERVDLEAYKRLGEPLTLRGMFPPYEKWTASFVDERLWKDMVAADSRVV